MIGCQALMISFSAFQRFSFSAFQLFRLNYLPSHHRFGLGRCAKRLPSPRARKTHTSSPKRVHMNSKSSRPLIQLANTTALIIGASVTTAQPRKNAMSG